MTIIDVDAVTFAYDGIPAVENVSLTVEAGGFLGIVGPNGSGKSTLLKLILGLLRPDHGSVRLFGNPAHHLADGERVGYVAQNAPATTREMPVTVREAVTMGRYPRVGFGRMTATDRDLIADALETVGIDDLETRPLNRLSGGQRQRVFIARALAANADLLALDEPAVGVDAESREDFYELLAALNADGMTILLVEHDIGVVTGHANRIACINRELYFHGDPAGFVASDALQEAYGANQRLLEHDHS